MGQGKNGICISIWCPVVYSWDTLGICGIMGLISWDIDSEISQLPCLVHEVTQKHSPILFSQQVEAVLSVSMESLSSNGPEHTDCEKELLQSSLSMSCLSISQPGHASRACIILKQQPQRALSSITPLSSATPVSSFSFPSHFSSSGYLTAEASHLAFLPWLKTFSEQ